MCLFQTSLRVDVWKYVFLQYSFYQQLHEQKKSEKFFKVLYDRMKAAQKEIRSTVTVNTIDLGNKKRDEDTELMTSGPRMRGEGLAEYLGEWVGEKWVTQFLELVSLCHLTYLSLIMPLVPLYMEHCPWIIVVMVLTFRQLCGVSLKHGIISAKQLVTWKYFISSWNSW